MTLTFSPLRFASRFFLLLCLLFLLKPASAQKRGAVREYIELKVYHAADTNQLALIEHYLQASYLPAAGKKGLNRIGVFKAIDNDTAKDKRLYVLIPLKSLVQWESLQGVYNATIQDTLSVSAYTKALHNKAPFTRTETILMKAFEGMPQLKPSGLTNDKAERIYELRSYESATEALHQNKVKMFNDGEVALFEKLGFNALFYGQVIAGSRMPNLVYMTSFANKASRDEHWKTFGGHPEWKVMSSKAEYQNNVSKIDITFLRATPYSKL